MKRTITTGSKYILLFFLLIINSLISFGQKGLTLEEGLSIAESNSPSMKRTKLSLVRSQENLNAQNAALKSQFSLSVNPISYSQNREFNDLISKWNSTKTTESFGTFTVSQPILLTDANISLVNRFGYYDSYSEYANATNKGFSNRVSLSLNQPLFTYNRLKLTLKELQLALENTQLNYAIQLLSLEKQVAQSFYNVYQKQQSLEISKQAFENMKKSYEVSKNKVDAGLSARGFCICPVADLFLALRRLKGEYLSPPVVDGEPWTTGPCDDGGVIASGAPGVSVEPEDGRVGLKVISRRVAIRSVRDLRATPLFTDVSGDEGRGAARLSMLGLSTCGRSWAPIELEAPRSGELERPP